MGNIDYRQQQRRRLDYMPWLYFRLKPGLRREMEAWQRDWQAELMALETIVIGEGAFVASTANLFAEPGRTIHIGAGASVAAEVFMHGPVTLGAHASINHHASLDGGRAGIEIGEGSRLAAYTSLYAFNHGMEVDRALRDQPVTSKGIRLGRDVWLGARAGIVDGVTLGDGVVVGMGAIVTRSAPDNAILAGSSARQTGWRKGVAVNQQASNPAGG